MGRLFLNILAVLSAGLLACGCAASASGSFDAVVGEPLPAWSDGCLDIHAVNSGRGECTFFILPDGTTMLVDAGEFSTNTNKHSLVDRKPSPDVRPYIVYSEYIRHFMAAAGTGKIDYMLLTHFHIDHAGCPEPEYQKSSDGDYVLTGISALYSIVPFDKIVDRGWPDYDDPVPGDSKVFGNYLKFICWAAENKGLQVEKFKLGSSSQFVLLKEPQRYPGFEIRNICVNGRVWDNGTVVEYSGKGPSENGCSAGFLLSYGKFDYFTAADISDNTRLEAPVAKAIGHPVEACKANHHMSWHTMSPEFLSVLNPKVVVSQSFYSHQPDVPVLTGLLPGDNGDRSVFLTNIHEETVAKAPDIVARLAGYRGHAVIRVLPGGDSFYVYMLDDTDMQYRVKSIHGPFSCE